MKKSRLIAIIAILIITIIIIITAYVLKSVNTTVFEDYTFYQYFGGQKVTYKGSIVLESKNSISEITVEDNKIQLDTTPMYFQDIRNRILFPRNMAVVYPMSNGQMYKINRFSIVKAIGKSMYLEKEDENKILENAFIYDGEDLYFFIQNTQIIVGEQTYEITPLSYVIASYNGNVEIYNKEKDEYTIIEGKNKNVIAQTEDYKINLSIDAILYAEKEQLLIKSINNLKNLE